MRVLFVLPPACKEATISLIEGYIFRLATALARRGIGAYLLAGCFPNLPEMQANGIRILPWPEFSLQALRSSIRDVRPHVVQVENRPSLIREIRRIFDGPLVLNLHNLTHLSSPKISRGELRVSLCLVDSIVLGSYYQKSLFLGRFFGLRARTYVVYPGVDAEVFRPYYGDLELQRARYQERKYLGLSGRDTVILAVSSLPAERCTGLIRDSLSVASNARLKIVSVKAWGDEDDSLYPGAMPSRQSTAQSSSVAQSELSIKGLSSLYRAADVCVPFGPSPTLHAVVNLEAQASGLPLVTAMRGGLVETVDRGAAFLVRNHDEATDWGRFLEVLADNEPLRRKMGQSGRDFSFRFRWDECALRFLAIYGASAPARAYGSSR